MLQRQRRHAHLRQPQPARSTPSGSARNSAWFLWKSIPSSIDGSQLEVTTAWKIGQQLWLRDYAGVHEAIRGFDWSLEFQGLVAAFSEPDLKEKELSDEQKLWWPHWGLCCGQDYIPCHESVASKLRWQMEQQLT